jgi:hypothetical protein
MTRGNPEGPKPHHYEMLYAYEAGETLQQIGDKHGITRERVRQILTKHFDCDRWSGGDHKRAADRAEKKKAVKDADYIRRFGHDREAHKKFLVLGREVRASGRSDSCVPLVAYHRQKGMAHRRNIEWLFTFASWWNFWQASGKWELRGKTLGHYVMARRGDVGPYSPENCRIVTCSENGRERAINLANRSENLAA